MKKVWFWLLILSVLMGMSAVAGAEGRIEPTRNIILIGWDGAQRNHLYECLGRGTLPNLRKLASEGALVDIDILGVTDTKAGWTQILTGYNPVVTGVYSNSQYQPIPKGLTVFERLEKHFGSDNIITLAVIGKKGHVDADPPKKVRIKEGEKPKEAGTKTIEDGGVKYQVTPGKPYYYTKDNIDLFENGLGLDEKVGTRVIELIEKHKDQWIFFFVHFAEVDHSGHKHGENSEEYTDALISNDFWVGKIMQKLKELDLYDKTLIYVTADHGFDEGKTSHKDAPYVFLATNDSKVIRRGERADITPTILQEFGLDLRKIKPPLDGKPLTNPGKSRAVGSRDTVTTIHSAASIGVLAKVKSFIDQGADINAKDMSDETPLHYAVRQGHKDIAELLVTKGADVNAKNKGGHTPLHFAAFKGHSDLAELLIANGADVNVKNKAGLTPLRWAKAAGHNQVVELLRKHGAKE